jgi:hypothetical protein
VKRKAVASPIAPAPTLSEIQDSLQSAILSGDDTILAALMDNSRTTRSTLFGVYRNAYVGRLAEILMNDYPLLRTYVGDDRFSDLARGYIAAHPSRTQNARWFGGEFPAFLQRHDSGALQLAELASIEKLVCDAFDSVDAPVLGLAELAALPPEDWGRLAFKPHPSAAVLHATTNAFALWRSLKDECTPAATESLIDPERVVVWRQGAAPMVRVMPYEEAMMWVEASRGARFGALCEMLATFDDPDGAALRAAGYLQGWLVAGMLTSAEAQDRSAKSKPNSVALG